MTTLPVLHHGERDHARLGASNCQRWWECPGSVWLEAELAPEDEKGSPFFAREGTAAHELSERCLVSGLDPETFIGQKFEGIEANDEMAASVRVYVDKVRQLAQHAGVSPMIETKMSLESLNPPEPMFGTVDSAIPDRPRSHLDVLDFKYGRGIVVEPKDNKQGLFYALGVVLAMDEKFETITLWIVQPRAPHPDGPIRSWTIQWDELVSFKKALMEAAHRVHVTTTLKVGDHCRFCRASSGCPAQREHAVQLVQTAFTADQPADLAAIEADLPSPEMLTQADILEVFEKAPIIERWFKAVRTELHRRQMAGVEVSGVKLVQTWTNRNWLDEKAVEAWLRLNAPLLDPDDYHLSALISPAQVEKKLKPYKLKLGKGLAGKAPTGYTTVLESDRRVAATPTPAIDAFETEGSIAPKEGATP